jgi:hypothetical protein
MRDTGTRGSARRQAVRSLAVATLLAGSALAAGPSANSFDGL